jgi:sec-independent protein translocase protein TatB
MFGLGISEIIVIVVAGLIFIGPRQLPDFLRSAGRFFVQVRRAANEVKGTVDGVIREAEDELRKEKESVTDTPEIKELGAIKAQFENSLARPASFSASAIQPPPPGDHKT